MQFQLTHNASDTDWTSNKSHILGESEESDLAEITPGMMQQVFGPGEDVNIPEKGYTDPEWYWKSSDGSVWGIAWRWGTPRLRGRGPKQRLQDGPFWVHPKKEAAAEFVNFLCQEVA